MVMQNFIALLNLKMQQLMGKNVFILIFILKLGEKNWEV